MSKVPDYIEIRVASTETKLITSLISSMPSTWEGDLPPASLGSSTMNHHNHSGTEWIASQEVLQRNKTYLQNKFESIQIAECVLEVGDIAFYYYDRDNKEKLLFLIERKTKSDLHASFIDHRYQEQSLRLRTHPELLSPRQVLYLLEVSTQEETFMSVSDKVEWFRTQSSLMIKPGHDFMVIQTRSVGESAIALLSFASKVLETIRASKKQKTTYPDQPLPYYIEENEQFSNLGYTPLTETVLRDKLIENTVVQMKKQGNLTPEMYFITSLGCIPNVGAEMAKSIALLFPKGMTDLIQEANANASQFVEKLSVCKFGSTKRQSSIGTIRATQILRFLCPHLAMSTEEEKETFKETEEDSVSSKKRKVDAKTKKEDEVLDEEHLNKKSTKTSNYRFNVQRRNFSCNVDL